jgi:hypothetical protein
MRSALIVAVLALAMVPSTAALGAEALAKAAAQQPSTAAGLQIVVIEGEDAVNIIQQKTAVAPIVEVRDRNNLPVSGVAVTFTIGGQGATFGGASTLTVVTNAAGQATAAGLTPTATGALQISATATFQGQTAVATIVQSNVMTAAEVAGAGGAAGSGSGAGGGGSGAGAGAGGGAGGMSATTLGIIGGAVAAGGLAATQAGGGDDSSATTSTPPGTTATTGTTTTTPTPQPSQPTSATFQGPMDATFSGTTTVSFPGEPAFSCSYSLRNAGSATLRIQTASNGSITGTIDLTGTQTPTAINCSGGFEIPIPAQPFVYSAPVTGSGNTVRFTQEFRDSGTVEGGSFTVVATVGLNATISGNTVTGTLSWNATADIRVDGGGTSRATWIGTMNISLR